MKIRTTISILSILLITACSSAPTNQAEVVLAPSQELAGLSKAYFASGCFWCVEAVFESVKGVKEAISGYSGGTKKNPTYREIGTGRLRHAEAVEVYYDPAVVSFATLTKVFFGSQDPTTKDRQGPDRGPQYRSIAFYQNGEEKKIIEEYIQELSANKVFEGEIITEVMPFEKFWIAEAYHQNYEKLHPNQPYVMSVSVPRLNRFKRKFPELLKEESGH
jgi:peptide-methionine (S)-S-oxide reductase